MRLGPARSERSEAKRRAGGVPSRLAARRPTDQRNTPCAAADTCCSAQTSSIEFSLVEKDVLYGLRQGTAVLKELNREMSMESVEKLMDETAEAVAYQRVSIFQLSSGGLRVCASGMGRRSRRGTCSGATGGTQCGAAPCEPCHSQSENALTYDATTAHSALSDSERTQNTTGSGRDAAEPHVGRGRRGRPGRAGRHGGRAGARERARAHTHIRYIRQRRIADSFPLPLFVFVRYACARLLPPAQTRAREGPREHKTVLPDVPVSEIPAVREDEQDERQPEQGEDAKCLRPPVPAR